MILASPGVARTPLLADFRARLGSFSACIFRRLSRTPSGGDFGRFSAQLGAQTRPQNSPEPAQFIPEDGRGCRPTWGCSRLGRPEARQGRLGPVLGPFWALFGALFGPSWRLLGRISLVLGSVLAISDLLLWKGAKVKRASAHITDPSVMITSRRPSRHF